MADMSSGESIAAILQDYVPRSEYEAALDALNQATEERNAARTDAGKHTDRLKDLETKLRGRSYRDAFDRIRKDAKVKDEFADDVFRLLGVEQDADEPDEKGMRKALEKFLGERKGYVDADERPARRTLEPGEGATRGASVRPGEPEMRVSRQQRNDAVWMRDNQARMLQAQRAGALVLED